MNQQMHQSHSFMPVWHTYNQAPLPQPQPLLQKPHVKVYGASMGGRSSLVPPLSSANVPPLSAQQKPSGSRRFSAGGVPQRAPVPSAPFPPVDRRSNNNNYRSQPFNGTSNNNGGLYQPPRGNAPRPPALFGSNQPAYSGRNSFNQPPRGPPAPKPSLFSMPGPFQPGMKDVPMWLKGLRLHKYTPLFQKMSYEEMMALNDQRLEQRQVTKGARKKILQSLLKLRDRSQMIRQLETCIDEHGDVRCLIVELRGMMNTPIPIYTPREEIKPSNYMIDAIGIPALEVSDENLPGHIARLCMRLHDYLFQNGQPQLQRMGLEDEYVLKLLQTYDKMIENEAFTYRQKYCIFECRRVLLRYAQEQSIVPSQSGLGTPPALMLQSIDSSPNGAMGGIHLQPYRRNSDPRESDDLLTTATTNTTSSAAHSDEEVFKSSQSGYRSTHSAPSSPMPEVVVGINANVHGVVGVESPRGSPAHTQTSSSAHSSAALNDSCWPPMPQTTTNSSTPLAAQFGPPPGFQPLPPMQQSHKMWTTNDTSSASSLNSLTGGNQHSSPWESKAPLRSPPFKRSEDIDAEKASITAILESNPVLYQHVFDYIQQQNGHRMHQFQPVQQPPKMPVHPPQSSTYHPSSQHLPSYSFASNRPFYDFGSNGGAEMNVCGGPLTSAEKLQFITETAGGSSEILDIAIRLSMCRLKDKQQREVATSTSALRGWQHQMEQPKRSTPTQTAPVLPSTWWTNGQLSKAPVPASTQQKTAPAPVGRNFFDEHNLIAMQPPAEEVKLEFFDPWHDTKPAVPVSNPPPVGLRTPQGTNSTAESANTLGKMLDDCFAREPKTQTPQTTSEWLMQQYGNDLSSAWSTNTLFGHSTAQRHPPTAHFGPHFHPLPCSASGAVH